MGNLKLPQINEVRMAGRLTRDAELKYTQSGMALVKNSIAVDRGFGEKKTTEFYEVKAWKEKAEKFAPQMRKGMAVIINGSLTMERWETKEGAVKEKPCIDVYQMHCLEWDDDAGSTQKTSPRAAQDAHSEAKSNGYQPQTDPEDDIPF